MLFGLSLFLLVGGCNAGKFGVGRKEQGTLEARLTKELKNMTSSEVLEIKVGDPITLSEGKVREAFVKLKGQKLNAYLHILPDSEEIVYAGLDDINEQRPVNKNKLEVIKKNARDFEKKNWRLFRGFKFRDSDKGIDFPKKGYVTYIWQDKSARNFIKVTVNGKNNKVVSFGRGNAEWTAFCLPQGYI